MCILKGLEDNFDVQQLSLQQFRKTYMLHLQEAFRLYLKINYRTLISCFILQVEREVEKHVLTQTKKLSDETYEKIFSRDVRNESGYFNYNCHICSVAGLSGEKALQTYITGRKHQQKLACDFIPNADQFRSMIAPDVKGQIFDIILFYSSV
jgi:hypothetical protein